jgi:Bcr/CflA subfamily drug resistance transporter
MKKWQYNKLLTILLMIPLVSLYSFSLDLYLPLLPKVALDLQASKISMQTGNSIFMLTIGIGQLIFGPISDHFGRKPTLITSLFLYIIGAALTVITTSLTMFILSRGLQALGACGTYLCCFASIRDIYNDENESAEMFSYLNIANSISAIIAPTIGAIIGKYYPWKIIFVILTTFSVVSLLLALYIYKETASPIKKKANNNSLLTNTIYNYTKVFRNINYQVFTLPAAVGIASFFAYYCVSPYLYQQVIGTSELQYGILYGSCGLTFFLGSFCCGQTVTKYGIKTTMWAGLVCHLVGTITLLAGHLILNQTNLIFTHTGIILILFGASYMVGAGIGGTMAPFQDIAGSAFALISAYKFVFAQIVGDIVMRLYSGNVVSLGCTLLCCNLIALTLLYTYKNKISVNEVQTAIP